MHCPTNTSVRTVIFWDLINEGPGFGNELIRYQTACPTNTPVQTVSLEKFIVPWTGGGGVNSHLPIMTSTQGGGEICDSHFSAFSAFFSHFLGRSLSVMFKRKHSSGIVL